MATAYNNAFKHVKRLSRLQWLFSHNSKLSHYLRKITYSLTITGSLPADARGSGGQERGFQMAGGSKMQGDIVIGNLSCLKKIYRPFETSTKPV